MNNNAAVWQHALTLFNLLVLDIGWQFKDLECKWMPNITAFEFNIWECVAFAGFRLALVQLAVGASKVDNLQNAVKHIKTAAAEGAKIVALPVSEWLKYNTVFLVFFLGGGAII